MNAYWANIPTACGGGYGVLEDKEIFVAEGLRKDKQRAILVALHEVAELHRPLEHHCDIDVMVIDQIDCLQQLGLL